MLRPSDAHLWVKCALAGQMLASGAYTATVPLYEAGTEPWHSDSKREGTCAHWVADCVFNGHAECAADMVGEAHSNGWVVDEEMVGHVQGYVDYVLSFGPAVSSEMPVELFNLVRGRLDTVSSGSATVLRIFDFKYGWRPVEVEENYSMLCYGAAVWEQHGGAVELHVYQPRPSHPDGIARVWKIGDGEMADHRLWLKARAEDCFVYPQGTPGHQCRDCPAAGSCHALAANVQAQYQLIVDDRMTEHTGAQLAAHLTFMRLAADLAAARLKAIEAEAEARISRSMPVPGWVLEPRTGNRKFTMPRDRVRLATGVDPVKTVKMSPAELERAGVAKHVVAAITYKPTIGRKLSNNPSGMADRLLGKPKD